MQDKSGPWYGSAAVGELFCINNRTKEKIISCKECMMLEEKIRLGNFSENDFIDPPLRVFVS